MTIGNKPKERAQAIEGKRYWWLSIGRDAVPARFFGDGWQAFEFVILKPFHDPYEQGQAVPQSFRFAFAFWLPIHLL